MLRVLAKEEEEGWAYGALSTRFVAREVRSQIVSGSKNLVPGGRLVMAVSNIPSGMLRSEI
jgi:hypothetical protein